MSVAIIRAELDAAGLRQAAARTKDADAARRMLALALVLDGHSRADAAQSCGMDRQTLRDWVHRYEHAKGKPVELRWQDEARIGRQGTLTHVWGEQGSRPPAPRDCRYSRAYIFGAVRPARGTGAALVMPFADKQAMTLHLPEISQAVTPGAHAIVIVDGAGWHKPGGRLTLQRQHPDPASLRTRSEPAREHLAVPSAELPRQPRLRHLRPHRPGMLRRLERPHPTTRAHQNNRVTRMGQGGQRLMPLV